MRRRTFFAMTFAVAILAVAPVVADVIDTSFYIIDEDSPADEDAIVLADSGSIESILDGDLLIAVYQDLTISGTVTGDVTVASGGVVEVTETGVVEGSIRGIARRVQIDGRVGDDVAVASITTSTSGEIGRDLIIAGGQATIEGSVGRNVQGWFYSGDINASVGNDVDVRVAGLDVGSATSVGGDLLYRADSDASIASGVEVAGSVARLSTRTPFVVRVSLALFTVFGLVAFAFLGLLVLWLSRSAAPRAAGLVVTRIARSAWVGFAAVVGFPALMWLLALAVQPFLAKVAVVVMFLVIAILAVLFGPIPALAAAGDRLTGGRAGLFGGFVVGVVLWRLIVWLVPILGLLLSVLLLIFGVGGWLTAWWDRRARRKELAAQRAEPVGEAAAREEDEWEPPLPPLPVGVNQTELAPQGEPPPDDTNTAES